LVARVGRRIDDSSPLVDSRLPDGSRLNVVIAPIALDGTSISIRKFSKNKKTKVMRFSYSKFVKLILYFSKFFCIYDFIFLAWNNVDKSA